MASNCSSCCFLCLSLSEKRRGNYGRHLSNDTAAAAAPEGICYCFSCCLVRVGCFLFAALLLLYINHVATCDRFWLVARSLLDLSLADICGLTLDILSVLSFFVGGGWVGRDPLCDLTVCHICLWLLLLPFDWNQPKIRALIIASDMPTMRNQLD